MPKANALYLAEQVREIDRRAMQQGLGGGELMRRAGAAAYRLLLWHWPRARRIAIVCGPGNNGGDGYVLGRLARAAGREVRLMALAPVTALRGDAQGAWQAFVDAGGVVETFAPEVLASCDVVVDALFGTGLERPLEGVWAEAVGAMARSGRSLLALDLPSGLHADSGAVLGVAVPATVTLSFIALKLGMFTGVGADYCGHWCLDDLAVPAHIAADLPVAACLMTPQSLRALLPARVNTSHKGDYGHVLVVGGNHGMAGAASLAGAAAYRSGAGRVSLAQASATAMYYPELMVHQLTQAQALAALLPRATVLAIGPGLGQDAWAQGVLATALESPLSKVVDADGLRLLAQEPQQRDDWVLTPHPGEAAALLACSTAAVQADRPQAAQQIAQAYGGVCVLKGAGTLITSVGGEMQLCPDGNPGMASAGMGDVLTGVIAALLAQGLSLYDAACLGVWLHASCGDRQARAQGEAGVIASDLLPCLGPALRELGPVDAL